MGGGAEPEDVYKRQVVDYMGEMKYLAQTYPEITKLSIIGYSWGIKDDAVALNGVSNDNVDPERSIPIYALEICNNPGEMDGRPATLHQAGNHGGELDANETVSYTHLDVYKRQGV